eukprot:CAMPEP_0170496456 /NCGR_PEP_ID=MMETSP0208-20121228/21642_1 /TAXON_ID=197538 /ORGANISM="Strombidium inclinatum, Strain S3" /LENGTH=98 /DNA_ID=CAMNT_0010773007 /DNA_START=880 /DNA_END=1176 /DNA_ORIENTATION=-
MEPLPDLGAAWLVCSKRRPDDSGFLVHGFLDEAELLRQRRVHWLAVFRPAKLLQDTVVLLEFVELFTQIDDGLLVMLESLLFVLEAVLDLLVLFDHGR